jgi:hypothetical protein
VRRQCKLLRKVDMLWAAWIEKLDLPQSSPPKVDSLPEMKKENSAEPEAPHNSYTPIQDEPQNSRASRRGERPPALHHPAGDGAGASRPEVHMGRGDEIQLLDVPEPERGDLPQRWHLCQAAWARSPMP